MDVPPVSEHRAHPYTLPGSSRMSRSQTATTKNCGTSKRLTRMGAAGDDFTASAIAPFWRAANTLEHVRTTASLRREG